MTATAQVFPDGLAPLLEATETASAALTAFHARSAEIRENLEHNLAVARQRFATERAQTLARFDALVAGVTSAYALPAELVRFAVLPAKEKHEDAIERAAAVAKPDMPPILVARARPPALARSR